MSKLELQKHTTYTIIDNNTGEQITESISANHIDAIQRRDKKNDLNAGLRYSVKSFVQMYNHAFIAIDVLGDSVILVKFFLSLKDYMNVGSSRLRYDSIAKKEIAGKFGWKNVKSVYKNMNKLVDEGIIIKKSRGEYHINPLMMWKGSEAGRQKAVFSEPMFRDAIFGIEAKYLAMEEGCRNIGVQTVDEANEWLNGERK